MGFGRRLVGCVGVKRFGGQRAVFGELELLDAALGFGETLAAVPDQRHALFVPIDRVLEADLALFDGRDRLLELLQGLLEAQLFCVDIRHARIRTTWAGRGQ